MSIEARVNKLGLNGLIEDGIHVHSKELIIASQVNVQCCIPAAWLSAELCASLKPSKRISSLLFLKLILCRLKNRQTALRLPAGV
jgi:hypothetical protein